MKATTLPEAHRRAGSGQNVDQQYLTFALGDELFGIPILAVQEIRGWERASAIPNSPAHILGVTSLRGTVVPVLDVRARLGMPATDVTPATVVIVVRVRDSAGERIVGCVVDAVSDVVDIEPASIGIAPDLCGARERHFVSGVATGENRLIVLLDLPGLVGAAAVAA